MKNRLLALIALSVLVHTHAEAFFRVKRTLSPSARAWAALRSNSSKLAKFAQSNKLATAGIACVGIALVDQYLANKKNNAWNAKQITAQNAENALIQRLNGNIKTLGSYAMGIPQVEREKMMNIFHAEERENQFFNGQGVGFDDRMPQTTSEIYYRCWQSDIMEIRKLAREMRKAQAAVGVQPQGYAQRSAQHVKSHIRKLFV